MDLMPTFLDLAGGSYPQAFNGRPVTPFEGQSFASVLTDTEGSADWTRDGMLFWEHMGHRAARQGDWKIVSDQPTGDWELFNMANDRTETVDVSAQNPQILSTLSAGYDAWKTRVGVLTWNDTTGYRP
jgi:arylsulfatase